MSTQKIRTTNCTDFLDYEKKTCFYAFTSALIPWLICIEDIEIAGIA